LQREKLPPLSVYSRRSAQTNPLAAIAKQPPDLILMDVQLPVMDGYTATRQIKADPALIHPDHCGHVLCTQRRDKKARAAGCDDYVPKPYSPRPLLAKIRQYMPE
jgi:two-component system cell cycle response regulator DivK